MLIRCNENKEIINLNNVSYIHPAESRNITTRPHEIYFYHSSASPGDSGYTVWQFGGVKEFSRVLSALEAKTL